MIRPLRDWDRFFFTPQTARVLGLYRIAIGLITLYCFLLFAKDVTAFFSDQGLIPFSTVERTTTRDFHTIFRWIHGAVGVKCALAALFAVGILFTVGLFTRTSSILLFFLVLSFHERNQEVLNAGDTVLRTQLFLFMFAPAGAALSLDSLRRRARLSPERAREAALVVPWAQRLMQLQVAIIYFVSAYAKWSGDLYRDGSAMYYVFGLIDFNIRGIENLMNYPVVYSALTFATLFVEISIPFLMWFRAARPYAVLMGLLLHLWIMIAMTIPVFGILMVTTYLSWFSEEEFDRGLEWLRGRFGETRLWRVLEGVPTRLARSRWIAGMRVDRLGRPGPFQGPPPPESPQGSSPGRFPGESGNEPGL